MNFSNLKINHELVCSFIAEFSRIEFALKASITYAEGNEKSVSANWDKFANSIHENFMKIEDEKLKTARSYLFGNQPKKQVLDSGELKFIETKIKPETTKELLVLVRRVRNNLFHGGKYHPNDDESRDKLLLQYSLVILKQCVKLDDDVYTFYHKI